MFRLIILSLFISSCATAKDWGPWYKNPIAQNEMRWEWCVDRLHGPDVHHKGLCYITKECRDRKTIFNNKRTECRPLTLICKWGDIQCMFDNGIFNRKIY